MDLDFLKENIEVEIKGHIIKRDVPVQELGALELDIDNSFELINFISLKVSKRIFDTELEENIEKLKVMIRRIENIKNFRHQKANKLLDSAENIFGIYEYLKENRNPVRNERRRFVNFTMTDKDYDDLKKLVDDSKDKSIVFKLSDFYEKFNIDKSSMIVFKSRIKGRFRTYQFNLKGADYIELHDFYKTSEIGIVMGYDPRKVYINQDDYEEQMMEESKDE